MPPVRVVAAPSVTKLPPTRGSAHVARASGRKCQRATASRSLKACCATKLSPKVITRLPAFPTRDCDDRSLHWSQTTREMLPRGRPLVRGEDRCVGQPLVSAPLSSAEESYKPHVASCEGQAREGRQAFAYAFLPALAPDGTYLASAVQRERMPARI